MDPITVLGAAGSVVGIVGFGLQLAEFVDEFITEYDSANHSLLAILDGIETTNCALEQVHGFLEDERENTASGNKRILFSEQALLDVSKNADQCLKTFWRIEATILQKRISKSLEVSITQRLENFHEELKAHKEPPVLQLDKSLRMTRLQRFKWSFKTGRELEKHNLQLHRFTATLTLLFQIMSIRATMKNPNPRHEDILYLAQMYEQIPVMAAQSGISPSDAVRPPSYASNGFGHSSGYVQTFPDKNFVMKEGIFYNPKRSNTPPYHPSRRHESLSGSQNRGRSRRKIGRRYPIFRSDQDTLERDRDDSRLCKNNERKKLDSESEGDLGETLLHKYSENKAAAVKYIERDAITVLGESNVATDQFKSSEETTVPPRFTDSPVNIEDDDISMVPQKSSSSALLAKLDTTGPSPVQQEIVNKRLSMGDGVTELELGMKEARDLVVEVALEDRPQVDALRQSLHDDDAIQRPQKLTPEGNQSASVRPRPLPLLNQKPLPTYRKPTVEDAPSPASSVPAESNESFPTTKTEGTKIAVTSPNQEPNDMAIGPIFESISSRPQVFSIEPTGAGLVSKDISGRGVFEHLQPMSAKSDSLNVSSTFPKVSILASQNPKLESRQRDKGLRRIKLDSNSSITKNSKKSQGQETPNITSSNVLQNVSKKATNASQQRYHLFAEGQISTALPAIPAPSPNLARSSDTFLPSSLHENGGRLNNTMVPKLTIPIESSWHIVEDPSAPSLIAQNDPSESQAGLEPDVAAIKETPRHPISVGINSPPILSTLREKKVSDLQSNNVNVMEPDNIKISTVETSSSIADTTDSRGKRVLDKLRSWARNGFMTQDDLGDMFPGSHCFLTAFILRDGSYHQIPCPDNYSIRKKHIEYSRDLDSKWLKEFAFLSPEVLISLEEVLKDDEKTTKTLIRLKWLRKGRFQLWASGPRVLMAIVQNRTAKLLNTSIDGSGAPLAQSRHSISFPDDVDLVSEAASYRPEGKPTAFAPKAHSTSASAGKYGHRKGSCVEAFTIRVVDSHFHYRDSSLLLPSITKENFSEAQILERIRMLNEGTSPVIGKKLNLPPTLQDQINKLLEDLSTEESATSYIWSLAQLEVFTGLSTGVLSVVVYLARGSRPTPAETVPDLSTIEKTPEQNFGRVPKAPPRVTVHQTQGSKSGFDNIGNSNIDIKKPRKLRNTSLASTRSSQTSYVTSNSDTDGPFNYNTDTDESSTLSMIAATSRSHKNRARPSQYYKPDRFSKSESLMNRRIPRERFTERGTITNIRDSNYQPYQERNNFESANHRTDPCLSPPSSKIMGDDEFYNLFAPQDRSRADSPDWGRHMPSSMYRSNSTYQSRPNLRSWPPSSVHFAPTPLAPLAPSAPFAPRPTDQSTIAASSAQPNNPTRGTSYGYPRDIRERQTQARGLRSEILRPLDRDMASNEHDYYGSRKDPQYRSSIFNGAYPSYEHPRLHPGSHHTTVSDAFPRSRYPEYYDKTSYNPRAPSRREAGDDIIQKLLLEWTPAGEELRAQEESKGREEDAEGEDGAGNDSKRGREDKKNGEKSARKIEESGNSENEYTSDESWEGVSSDYMEKNSLASMNREGRVIGSRQVAGTLFSSGW